MNDVKSSEEAQMMTLEALIASLLIIVAVLFVVSQVPPQVQQEGGYSEVQLRHYGEDVVTMLEANPSPDKYYQNLLQYYISENKYDDLDNFLNDSLPDNVGYSVALVSGDERENLFSNGYPCGEQIVVSEIVVSRNVSIGGIPGAAAGIRKVEKTFPAGSLIIPMDDETNTETGQKNILPGMGLVYNIAKGTYSDGKSIPVWQILQDPRNDAYMFFDWSIYTNDNPSNVSNGTDSTRKYAGGPYLIDATDLTPEIKQKILNASKMEYTDDIKMHQVINYFTYYPVIKTEGVPIIAAYPPHGVYDSKLNSTVEQSFLHSGIQYIVINDTLIKNNILDEVDIIISPDADLSQMPGDVTAIIIDWVSNGGTFHAECRSILTLDTKVESIDGNNHSWHGFIGIGNTNVVNNSMVLVGNDSHNDTSFGIGYGPFADPGAVFNSFAQSGDRDGTFDRSGGVIHSFQLIGSNGSLNYSRINPEVTILAGSSQTNTTGSANGKYIVYATAPFDRGMVTYLAGYNMSEDYNGIPTPHKERLMFHTIFYPCFRKIYDYGVVELRITMWYK